MIERVEQTCRSRVPRRRGADPYRSRRPCRRTRQSAVEADEFAAAEGERNDREAIPYWHVDAFARPPFAGNQAAVSCRSTNGCPTTTLQAIAEENNVRRNRLPRARRQRRGGLGTALVHPDAAKSRLCGHATLASGHVLLTQATAASAVDLPHAQGRACSKCAVPAKRLRACPAGHPDRAGRLSRGCRACWARSPQEVWLQPRRLRHLPVRQRCRSDPRARPGPARPCQAGRRPVHLHRAGHVKPTSSAAFSCPAAGWTRTA